MKNDIVKPLRTLSKKFFSVVIKFYPYRLMQNAVFVVIASEHANEAISCNLWGYEIPSLRSE
jgi:hypothetical protein